MHNTRLARIQETTQLHQTTIINFAMKMEHSISAFHKKKEQNSHADSDHRVSYIRH